MGGDKTILHIISDLSIGGAQAVVMSYLRCRQDFKVGKLNVLVITENSNSIFDAEVAKEGYPVEYLGYRPTIVCKFLSPIVNFIRLQWMLLKKIYQLRPYIIHSHGTRLLPYLLPTFILLRPPYIVHTLHSNPTAISKCIRIIAKMVFHCFPIMPICVSEDQARLAANIYGLSNVKVVYNGVDSQIYKRIVGINRNELRKQLGISLDSFVMGYIGRLSPVKNLTFLVNIFSEYLKIRPDAFLLIIGNGLEKTKLVSMVNSYKIDKSVIFLDFQEDVYSYYKMLDLFMLTSFSESCSITTLEAQIAGIRCVVSDNVPRSSIISNLVCRVSLEAPKKNWMDAIQGYLKPNFPTNNVDNYRMTYIVEQLSIIYSTICNR